MSKLGYRFWCAILIFAMVSTVYSPAYAFEADNEGRVKFSFDSIPALGSSDKCSSGDSESNYDAEEDEQYTYNAMGQKVPVKTKRSGNASAL